MKRKSLSTIILFAFLIVFIAVFLSGCSNNPDNSPVVSIIEEYSLEDISYYYDDDEIESFINKHLWDYFELPYFYECDKYQLYDYLVDNDRLGYYIEEYLSWNTDDVEFIERHIPPDLLDYVVIDAFQKDLLFDYIDVMDCVSGYVFEYAPEYFEIGEVLEYYNEEDIAAFVAEYNSNHH